jgi:hypothetical protein
MEAVRASSRATREQQMGPCGRRADSHVGVEQGRSRVADGGPARGHVGNGWGLRGRQMKAALTANEGKHIGRGKCRTAAIFKTKKR